MTIRKLPGSLSPGIVTVVEKSQGSTPILCRHMREPGS
jgi:hypothetical protein